MSVTAIPVNPDGNGTSKVCRLLSELGPSLDWPKMAAETPRSAFGTYITVGTVGPDTLVATVNADAMDHTVKIIVCLQEPLTFGPLKLVFDPDMDAYAFQHVITIPDIVEFVIVFCEPWKSVRGTEPE